MSTQQTIHLYSELEYWRHLLLEWQHLQQRYHLLSDGDLAYWYGEVPSVSLLAGAAWRSGWVALQEYADTKHWKDEEENKSDYRGKIDLWLKAPQDPAGVIIEAKHCWISLNDLYEAASLKRLPDAVEKKLAEAVRDARNSKTGKSSPALAMVFVVPEIDADTPAQFDTPLASQIQEIEDGLGALVWEAKLHLAASCFSKDFAEVKYRNRYQYPAVFMLGRRILRGA